jgi:uncharacterized repeat protein (TIGR03843 family)
MPEMVDVGELLATAEIKPRGFLANASNHTLLVQIGAKALAVHGVYKPSSGERPLWDFPPGTLAQREAAAFAVSEALGWDMVPPTAFRSDGPMGPGSVQLFVPHDPELHYFVLVEDPDNHPTLARMALFDLLVNNADRKASHVLLSDDGRIRGIDHGLTFHVEPKLRTVIWELGGRPLADELRADLGRLARVLADDEEPLTTALGALLHPDEVAALAQRASILRGLRALPDIEPEQRPYPWPPL